MKTQFEYPKHLYPFQSKWTNINGNPIHYIDEGKGDVILFCHPPVTSSFMYRNLISELSKHFRCVAIDFPGFGMSASNSADSNLPTINSWAEILEQFLSNLKLESVYLLMQECGGHAAMKIFLQQPDKLKGIIITDTLLFPVSKYPRIKRMLTLVNGSVFNFINTNFNFLIRAMTRFGIQKRKLTPEERSVYKSIFRTKSLRRASTNMLHQLVVEKALIQQIQKAFETTFRQIPALIIFGEKDPLTEMKVPQKIHAMLTNSQLHFIKGEAHFPHEGAPEEMNQLIINWMTK